MDVDANGQPERARFAPLIGRESDLARVRERLLSGDEPLVLTGPPGVGKTRLALAAAVEAAGCLGRDFRVVDLSPLRDPSLVIATVARALSIVERGDGDLAGRIAAHLRETQPVLVLDNFEHLLGAVPAVAGLLRSAGPAVRAIITSRVSVPALKADEVSVAPLGLPRASGHSPGMLASSPAVVLFAERVRAVHPDFELTPANAGAVAEICVRLDGLPLAIELAAARTRLLSVEQIAARLDDRLRLLAAAGPFAPRQGTLRAALDWSYSLLEEPERALLAGLAVFAGSFDLDAVEAVAAGGPPGAYPLDALGRLADHSLLVTEGGAGEARYRLLETIRIYARERLRAGGGEEDIIARHLRHYAALAEREAARLSGPEQAAALARLDREYDNIRAALAAAAAAPGSAATGLAAAAALEVYWETRGLLSEGRRWLDALLAAAPDAPAGSCARALQAAGQLAWRQGDYHGARERIERSLALLSSDDEPLARAEAHARLAAVTQSQGLSAEAEAHAEQALAIFERLGDRAGAASVLSRLGNIARQRGDLAAAWRWFERSLSLARADGPTRTVAILLTDLGVVANELGDAALARTLHAEAIEIHRRLGNLPGEAVALYNLAQVEHDAGDNDRSETLHGEALAHFRRLGNRAYVALCLTNLGHVARRRGDFVEAGQRYREALGIAREVDGAQPLAWCLWGPGFLAAAEGRYLDAARLLGAAEAARAALGYPLWPAARNDLDAALAAIRAALDPGALTAVWTNGRALSPWEAAAEAAGERPRALRANASPTPPLPALPAAAPAATPVLTWREREVLALLARGRTNKQIARALVLSVRTVEHHVAALYRKLGTHSRAETVEVALARPDLLPSSE